MLVFLHKFIFITIKWNIFGRFHTRARVGSLSLSIRNSSTTSLCGKPGHCNDFLHTCHSTEFGLNWALPARDKYQNNTSTTEMTKSFPYIPHYVNSCIFCHNSVDTCLYEAVMCKLVNRPRWRRCSNEQLLQLIHIMYQILTQSILQKSQFCNLLD